MPQLPLKRGYWRWRRDVDTVLACPDNAQSHTGCIGGDSDYCKPGLSGPYCGLCAKEVRLKGTHYYNKQQSTCDMCGSSSSSTALLLVLLLVLLYTGSSLLPRLGVRFRRVHTSSNNSWYQLKYSYKRFHMGQKAALLIKFLQLVSNVPGVYIIRYPDTYGGFVSYFDSFLTLDGPQFPPLECYGVANYASRLSLFAQLPLLLMFMLIASRLSIAFGRAAVARRKALGAPSLNDGTAAASNTSAASEHRGAGQAVPSREATTKQSGRYEHSRRLATGALLRAVSSERERKAESGE